MVDLEDLDLEIELASFLGNDNGWDMSNILDNIGTPSSPSNSPNADLHEPNSTREEEQQRQQELDFSTSKTLPTNENEEPDMQQAADLICVELISKIAGSSMTQMGCFYHFSPMQNENSNKHEVLGIPYYQSISNPLLMPNIVASNNFNGINHHSLPYPTLFYALYPVEVRAGVEIGHSSGQLITNQSPALQSNIIPHIALIPGQPGPNQFPTPNVYGSHYAPNYMQYESSTSNRQPNSFTPLLLHDGHAVGMPNGLQSQNYLQATYPTYPKPEQQVHLHPALVPVPPNPQAHQHGYNGSTAFVPVAPNPQPHQHGYNRPTAPTAFVPVPPNPQAQQQGYNRPSAFVPVAPNPHANQHGYIRPAQPVAGVPSVPPVQSRANPTTYNFFGPGSSNQPPTYPVPNDNQNNHHILQATWPGGHLQQGVVGPLKLPVSQGVPEQVNGNNLLLSNTHNIQRQSNPLHEPIAPSHSVQQAQCSRNLQGLPGAARASEGSSSQGSNNASPYDDQFARLINLLRPEQASGVVQQEQVAPIPTNAVTNQRDKGKLPESSTTSLNVNRQPSEAIRRILDMNPRRTVTRNPQQNQGLNLSSGRRGSWIPNLRMQLASKGATAARRGNGPIAAPLNLTAAAEQGQIEKPRRGRPPKRRGPIEISSSSKHQKTGPSTSPKADETPQNVKNEDQNANPTAPSSASSECFNSMFDPAFMKNGLPVDPHLRFQASLFTRDAPSMHGGSV